MQNKINPVLNVAHSPPILPEFSSRPAERDGSDFARALAAKQQSWDVSAARDDFTAAESGSSQMELLRENPAERRNFVSEPAQDTEKPKPPEPDEPTAEAVAAASQFQAASQPAAQPVQPNGTAMASEVKTVQADQGTTPEPMSMPTTPQATPGASQWTTPPGVDLNAGTVTLSPENSSLTFTATIPIPGIGVQEPTGLEPKNIPVPEGTTADTKTVTSQANMLQELSKAQAANQEQAPAISSLSSSVSAETAASTFSIPRQAAAINDARTDPLAVGQPPGVDMASGLKPTGAAANLHEPARTAEARSTDLAKQVGLGVETLMRQGQNTLRLQLYPEELGKIDLRLTVNSQGTWVVVSAEQQSTSALLQRHLDDLKQSLVQAGVQLGGLTVSQDNRRDGTNTPRRYTSSGQGSSSVRLEQVAQGLETLQNTGLVSGLQTSGVDYRV